jgi:mannonate dehydratase
VIAGDPKPVEEFREICSFVQSYGMKVYDVRWSVPNWLSVTRGLADRDKQIELCCNAIRVIGKAGVPFCGYTFSAIGHFRTIATNGRGGARYSTFDYQEFLKSSPNHKGAEISEEELWENIEYFLKRVVPVSEKAGVKLALHPDDPPISEYLGGAARIVTGSENYKRIFDLVPSDSNAMLFCQGCFSESGEDVIEAIRYFGAKSKICMVHFRNIRGNPHKFQEVFIDEGEVDMFQTMQAYHRVGFQGPFLVDHTPSIPQMQASRAYAIGYTRAMIQAAYR